MKLTVLRINLLILILGHAGIGSAQVLPTLSNVHFTDTAGGPVDANGLQRNLPVRLNMTLFNFSPDQEVSAGNFELRIEMGSIATLPSGVAVKKLPYADYITWSYEKGEKRNAFLHGEIIKPLPANFVGKLQIDLQCVASGSSEIQAGIYSHGKILTNTFAQAFFTVLSK